MKVNKNFLIWALIFLGLFILTSIGEKNSASALHEKLAYSDFMTEAENKRVAEVTVSGPDIRGKMTDGTGFYTYAPYDSNMIETLRKNNVKVNAKPVDTGSSTFWGVFVSWFPMLLLIGVWIFFMRQANSGNNKALSFGKSRAR